MKKLSRVLRLSSETLYTMENLRSAGGGTGTGAACLTYPSTAYGPGCQTDYPNCAVDTAVTCIDYSGASQGMRCHPCV
jgi:hypothetical protein